MKRVLNILLLISAWVVCGCSTIKEQEKAIVATEKIDAKYHLLWSDEFDGTELNKNNWNIELRQPGWTNNELQEYTNSKSNVYLRDGFLVLKAQKSETDNGNIAYTSGKVNSQNKRDFTYGKVVVRAKVPVGKGLWPAIWMMPKKESTYGQWPRCGEIDIMEVLGSEANRMYGTLHYGVPHKQNQGSVKLDAGSFASDFHEYSVEWEPGEIRFLLDGNLYYSTNNWFSAPSEDADELAYPAPFNQPFFVQMNLAVGGDWPGNPDEHTDFNNAEFLIDYVRVYQLSDYDTNVTKPQPDMTMRKQDETGNFIHNGDFSTDESLTDSEDWSFLLFGKGAGSAEIKDNTLVVTTKNPGELDYAVQIVQPQLPMRKGLTYKITFDAKADGSRTGIVALTAPEGNWIRYFPDTKFDMGTSWQTYTYTFKMSKKDDPYGRLEFNLGNQNSSETVYIRNVRVESIK